MGDCYKFKKLINDFIDNDIDTAGTKQLEDHTKQCASCNLQLKSSQELKQTLKTLPQYKTSASFELVLRSKLRNEMYKRPGLASMSWLPSFHPFPAYAALGILLVVFGYFMAGMIHTNNPVATPQFVVSNPPAPPAENIAVTTSRPVADDGYIKMKNYVNLTEQLPGNQSYSRELSEYQSNRGRIEKIQDDSLQRMTPPPGTLNKPLIRQANTIVHF